MVQLKENMENITEELFDLKSKINFQKINNLNQLNIESLKQINIYYLNEMKENIINLDNDINDFKLNQENNK